MFLLRKFNIDHHDDLVGTNFGKWVKHSSPERRAGKPVLNGRSWETQHDPWRGISRTAFALDYLKQYPSKESTSITVEDEDVKMMELNCYDAEDLPTYGYDVYVQRLSCYIQHDEPFQAMPDDPDIKNPYNKRNTFPENEQPWRKYFPNLETLDNGNAIIIFENSQSGSIEDTLIAARKDWESRWRRLPFYLTYESQDVSNDDRLALLCMKMVLQDVFKSVAGTWDSFLEICSTHVSILEDKIYEQPADESRAPELWTNSSRWLKVEKLMSIHVDVGKDMKNYLGDLIDSEDSENTWLSSTPSDFERLTNLIQEDLVKPTANLADLMYKSVGIRDSRHSLMLGTSMWRLSWITFIFLPLTFIVGFFGMNVDTFAGNPSIKWYFISSVPLMLCILALWYFVKHSLARQRQTPYQRGIYEHMFHDLATNHPSLWSRSGPRHYIIPIGFFNNIKWRLIMYWAAPDKTIRARQHDVDAGDDLGTWSRIKRTLIRTWTAQIRAESAANTETNDPEVGGLDSSGVVANGVVEATELLVLPGADQNVPALKVSYSATSESRRASSIPAPLQRPLSRGSGSGSRGRESSAGRASGVMVEEEEPGWLSKILHRPASPPGRPWSRGTGSSGGKNSAVMVDETDVGGAKGEGTGRGPMPESMVEGLGVRLENLSQALRPEGKSGEEKGGAA
ncbi:MAG: hypothetical protein M1827_001684 [Pycnora praestabilis]|nr:MAG: hypothetical protein M1827_001684 [Pycnora praestabilis]